MDSFSFPAVDTNKVQTARQKIKANQRPAAKLAYLESIPKLNSDESRRAPNIIMILMDDMGWGDISCFGSQAIHTPNLDRLAREGAVLKNCYSSSPVCTPSRFGLLTGRYPCRGHISGVYFPTAAIDARYVVPQGYERPEDEVDGKASPALIAQTQTIARHVNSTLPTEGILEDEITMADVLRARGYRTGMFGKWHLGDQSPHLPNDMGFEYFFGAHYSNDMCPYHFWRNREIAIEAPFDQRRITEYLNDELFGFIDRHAEAPFLAYYASPWPHHPLSCGEAFAGRSKAGTYGDCIEEFDQGIGQLLDLLAEKKLSDKTMIVFTSDNGPWHQGSPGGHRGRKGNVFDGGQVVPTICWWPGKFPSQTTQEQAMNIDFLPTFCEMAGVDLPQDRVIDGRSLLPLLTGLANQSPHDELLYVKASGQGPAASAIRSRDHFKYYLADKSDNSAYTFMPIHPFLFDLAHDRDESYDVKVKYPEKTAELKARLETFNKQVEENPRGWL